MGMESERELKKNLTKFLNYLGTIRTSLFLGPRKNTKNV